MGDRIPDALTCRAMPGGGIVSSSASTPLTIEKDGKSWRFEFSKMFGPSLLDKHGIML